MHLESSGVVCMHLLTFCALGIAIINFCLLTGGLVTCIHNELV